MTMKELEQRIKTLESEVRILKDIREIEILQRAYGYYLEHWMADEVIDCFADSPEVELSLYEGTWLGKGGIRRYFKREQGVQPTFLHQVMQLSPIIHVEPDGELANGRWYSWGAVASPGENGIRQFFMGGIYEAVYKKEDGKWKILKLKYSLHIAADPREGWVKPDKVAKPGATEGPRLTLNPDIPPGGMDSLYPSGFIFPFHFKHPVTGKETSELKRNAALKFRANRLSRAQT